MTRCLIYGLVDPRTNLVRYIGLSSTGMRRPREHRTPTNLSARNHKSHWIRELLKAGLDYTIVVLEEVVARGDLPAAERWWIAYGRACGWPLTNLTDGGDGAPGARWSEAARARHLAVMQTLEFKAKTSGWKHTPETRARMSAERKGRRMSEATKKKVGELHRNKHVSAETRAKLSAALKRYRAKES